LGKIHNFRDFVKGIWKQFQEWRDAFFIFDFLGIEIHFPTPLKKVDEKTEELLTDKNSFISALDLEYG
jgi:hypothetical protein